MPDSASQFPVDWYFDETILALEEKLLFAAGPGYAGHALMAESEGCYRALEWLENGQLILNHADAHWLLSNVCRHRQAIMLKGSGQLQGALVCPIHRWTYDDEGTLKGAPHFPENPCLNLNRVKLENWNGLLFKGPRCAREDLAGMSLANSFDFSGYKLDKVVLHECDYSWKTFIEVYLEDYHVAPFHPGLGNFVTCDDLSWQFAEWYSVQKVGITPLMKSGSAVYERWQKIVREYYADRHETPPQGAVWLTYYPNIMVEWYPHVLVVSTVWPRGLDKTRNVVEFYYPEEIISFEREFIEAEQAAYMETAIEDDDIGARMDQGRKALFAEGRSEIGPYQSPMEDGMRHFHRFYRRLMEAEILKARS
ncbi:MAG: aromatic ring-hydroxylating dioxygenase subunit alpha [Zoogloeaceae bacterium]|jgi:phenylpropionate dioxygenase-like ring-hydroxylating dioxygenase large terminal subunit|nr:aromatic ring-hydroxylating dioxygenase subunit alpha [Zoogloeaceae bacterium]